MYQYHRYPKKKKYIIYNKKTTKLPVEASKASANCTNQQVLTYLSSKILTASPYQALVTGTVELV